ncbi:uncharacterized protein LOC129266631 [Lytechinus pictus]|uniref:uncharacterized protein LOC129266631 n=1 Tax=Lytechinus pictus TaxID=7653 RepID=UPI0030B9DFB1
MASHSEPDFDEVLKLIAEDITNEDHIERLGKALGFRKGPIENYIKSNFRFGNVTSRGTLQMLRDWNLKVSRTQQFGELRAALIKANLQATADDHLPQAGLWAPRNSQSAPPGQTQEGPSIYVTESQIMYIARNLLSDFYSPFASALGFSYAEYENIKRKHLNDIKEATLDILNQWKRNTGGLRIALEAALNEAECARLAYTYKDA